MDETSLDHPLFDESIETIEHTLLDHHRRTFDHVDSASLLNELRSIATHTSTNNRTVIACSRRFTLFVRTFAPYFDVLSICTRVKEAWPGCLWALVRLVFQVASDYVLFLEKIADLFEVMANILPPYQEIYVVCMQRMNNLHPAAEDERLTTLMSYVYADLIKLCLDCYRIFFRNNQSLESHHTTYIPLLQTQWRPIDSRFAQLEGRLTRHRRWLEKETKSQVQDFAEVEQHRKHYIRFLHQQAENNSISHGEQLDKQRIAKRVQRVESIRRWLSNSAHSRPIDSATSRTDYLGSCNWFLDLTQYRRWKNADFEQQVANDAIAIEGNWHDRVLFVQAGAGYGKTVLASAVFHDLAAEAEDPERSSEPPSAAHFHINTNISEPVHPDDVFRQLSIQLLQTHRHDHATLDAVCLLLRRTSFQDMATASEVLDVLALLLRQHPTYLVIDGLESFNSGKAFLSSLAGLCRKANVRAIIFSRPTITIPLEYQKWASDAPHIMSLDVQHNTNAIEGFVSQNLHQMADLGYFGISMDRSLILHVAQRANGMFLWANLLLGYLQSPALTPDERQTILVGVQSLHGLDAVYGRIFRTLEHQPAYEKRVVADVLRWLTFPIHQLCTSALRTALTSTVDTATNKDSWPADILHALPQLTCGLVEVSDDGVSFVHSSVRDYLLSSASQGSQFSLGDECSVHAHLATRCIAYLAHSVPKRPLGGLSPGVRPMLPADATSSGASYRTSKSGDSGYKSISSVEGDNALPQAAIPPQHNNANTSSVRAIPFDTNLPFLRYASLCWPIHLSRALASTHNDHPYVIPCPGPFEAVPYIPALSAFLSSRLAITAWVEASFRYSLPPTLTRLVGPLADLKGEIPPATIEGKELRLVISDLNILSERLMELKRGYATSLRENPSLIWQMGSAVGEDYWPVWDGSTGMPR